MSQSGDNSNKKAKDNLENENVVPIQSDSRELEDKELHSLLATGQALTSEHETSHIMDMILEKAIENTNADGGSIYLMERIKQDSLGGAKADHKYVLRFHKSSNRSANIDSKTFTLPLDSSSIAGHAALSKNILRIIDCYKLPESTPYSFNHSFDKKTGYRTKSILAVPIQTSKGKVIGVVQLINKLKAFRRRDDRSANSFPHKSPESSDVVSFSKYDEQLMEAFASHAAIALENAKLTEDIARLFESFVRASVTAIEARDPTTSGHSDRVATLTCGFAEVVDTMTTGIFKDIKFSTDQMKELRYAALLHDFGKIGVRENILLKGKKLFPNELETILLRLETLRAKQEAFIWKQAAEDMTIKGANKSTQELQAQLGQALWQVDNFTRQLEEVRKGILQANEPQVLDNDLNIKGLLEWIDQMSNDMGQVILQPEERKRLSIPRGTLGEDERVEIESHVTYTYEFLSQIAWTDDLSGVPEIAHAHHEKLDGTGYPRRLTADSIPVQARMMTVSDIYDALTAMDRPYKKAVSAERAIEILYLEAEANKLDVRLVDIFVQAKIFERVVNMDGIKNTKKKVS